ncbi:MAG: rubrerythrin family protein [Clostridiales bacterium]|jgi:VIT1/CCC1 family predicted Fe2+/Mn2+ transporter|nr:rubrerythrin family protein [Clostridiales bacterium]
MDFKSMDEQVQKAVLAAQKNEITEYHIYSRLSRMIRNRNNQAILERIGREELAHYKLWTNITRKEIKPCRWKIWMYTLIARVFGLTFGIKLMEKGEERAEEVYSQLADSVPRIRFIVEEENRHEKELMELIEEEHLNYIGSMVLGMNDALVELTGTLAGLTFALQNTKLIALTGFITGIAASFSMAASEYLSKKSEADTEDTASPLKSSIYTGVAYIFTVLFLIFPYLLFDSYLACLGFTIINAIVVIFAFNFYISVAKDLSFKKRFIEMVSISLGVAAFTFLIGFLVRTFIGVDI